MTVQHPWMMIVGCAFIGWITVEVFAALSPRDLEVPVPFKIMAAISFALIAAAVCA